MQVRIAYKSGEKRVINLHPDFFTSTQVDFFNKKTSMVEKKVLTPSDKAVILAESLSARPYTIVLDRNGAIQMNKKIYSNEPLPPAKYVKLDEKAIKKELKKEYRLKNAS